MNVSAFIGMFCGAYKQHRKASYFVRRPKDLTLAKLLLETYEPDELTEMVDDLLTTQDEWIAGTDRGVGILVVKASWLANRRAERAQQSAKVVEFWGDVCSREHGGACQSRFHHELKMREAS
jgi:hypothetical protein